MTLASAPYRDLSFPLFAQADRPERFTKPCAAGTDSVIIDVEDAVPAHADEMEVSGKLLTHPRQIGAILQGCRPDPQDLNRGWQILDCVGTGAIWIAGEMADAQVVARVRRSLRRGQVLA